MAVLYHLAAYATRQVCLIRTGIILLNLLSSLTEKRPRELPHPVFQAMQQALSAMGKELAAMKPEQSLWPCIANSERGVTSGAFYGNLRRYFKAAGLPPAGVHIFHHSAAKLRREARESVEQVSHYLDHNSLAVTTVCLRQLEGDRDTAWRQVASALGD